MRTCFQVLCAVLLAASLSACDDGSGDSGGLSTNVLAGTWAMDMKSDDGSVSFTDAPLKITATADPSTYTVAWYSDMDNGWAVLDTNTLTVLITVTGSSADLAISGLLDGSDTMAGGGTVNGFGGVRACSWKADRQ